MKDKAKPVKKKIKEKSAPANRQKKPKDLRKPRNPHPLPPPVEHQFKPGQSGNPSGRPKLLGESYKARLAQLVPNDPEGRTYAEMIAGTMVDKAIMFGDVPAAKEIRTATEGDKVHIALWQAEIAEQIKAGHLKPEDVIRELGNDGARDILIAAGSVVLSRQPEADQDAASSITE
jgi:hypothetical protein